MNTDRKITYRRIQDTDIASAKKGHTGFSRFTVTFGNRDDLIAELTNEIANNPELLAGEVQDKHGRTLMRCDKLLAAVLGKDEVNSGVETIDTATLILKAVLFPDVG